VAEHPNPIDKLLDVVLYGPVGFLAEARELQPKMAETGRNVLDVQVRTARMIGQFAVALAKQRAEALLKQAGQRAAQTQAPASSPPGASTAAPPAVDPGSGSAADPEVGPEVEVEIPVRGASAAVDLAIPSYDTLAASQVVPRLAGLTPQELAAVLAYESSHRNRRTILGRIAQLTAP